MEKSEAVGLPLAVQQRAPASRRPWRVLAALLVFVATVSWSFSSHSPHLAPWNDLFDADVTTGCEQVDPLVPKLQTDGLVLLEQTLASEAFRNASVERLSKVVQIPSVSYDDMGEVGDDDRFDIFYEVEDYLKNTFPLVHSKLKKETVNTHGLLYTWNGSDSALKPTLLMAHQDVVPVEKSTINTWTHPPFSGYFDGKYVWGRGASDCKNSLIGILEAVELLLLADFEPKRTLLISFGFDEEISGHRGAGALSKHILEQWGKDSIAAIVDEGASSVKAWGTVFAAPAVSEKGYTDVHITVRTPGGHSSVPSAHTGIGIISELITLIESEQYSPWLADGNPYLGSLQCAARYSPSFPKKLKKLLSKRNKEHKSISPNAVASCQKHKHVDELAEAAAEIDLLTRYVMQTSQAVDLIVGGAKINALPELVSAVVNHRVNIGEHPSIPEGRIAHLAAKVAKKYNLTLNAYPEDPEDVGGRSITLSTGRDTLEFAPPTPIDIFTPGTSNLSPYGVLSGTTRALYGEELKVAPGLMTGNTDTRYYWDLSKHIFRYNPGLEPEEDPGLGKIHTVDEAQSVVAHVNSVKWFAGWIRNVDEAVFE